MLFRSVACRITLSNVQNMYHQRSSLAWPFQHYVRIIAYCSGVLRPPLYSMGLRDWVPNVNECLTSSIFLLNKKGKKTHQE